MKPWRRTEPTKNGVLVLPKECEEFLMHLSGQFLVDVWSVFLTSTKLLTFNEATQGVELYSFHGIKRGSFWDISVVAGLGETNLSVVLKWNPVLVPPENYINFRVKTTGGTPTYGVLTGMWR